MMSAQVFAEEQLALFPWLPTLDAAEIARFSAALAANVQAALAEDLGDGDKSSALLQESSGSGSILAREAGVLAGAPWCQAAFMAVDKTIHCTWHYRDGDSFSANSTLCTVEGPQASLVTAERTALNFLQTLSGTATATAKLVAALAGSRCRLLDTRKTLPGLRLAQKYAVRCGGGENHRFGLYDMILLKENHLAQQEMAHLVAAARQRFPTTPIVIEVENLTQLKQALTLSPLRILLDNFSVAELEKAVALSQGQVPLEASGNITLENIQAVAFSGVDYLSSGSITKHVKALDLSLRLEN
jgi:nicotinate-nucleotide pyrophosphorylase (carboxylating)